MPFKKSLKWFTFSRLCQAMLAIANHYPHFPLFSVVLRHIHNILVLRAPQVRLRQKPLPKEAPEKLVHWRHTSFFLQWNSHHLGHSLPALSCARLGELLIQEKWNWTSIILIWLFLAVLIYGTATLNCILKTSLKFLPHLSFLNQCFYGRTRARSPSSWCHSVSIFFLFK